MTNITLKLVYPRGKSAMNTKQERRLSITNPDVTTKGPLYPSHIEIDPVCNRHFEMDVARLLWNILYCWVNNWDMSRNLVTFNKILRSSRLYKKNIYRSWIVKSSRIWSENCFTWIFGIYFILLTRSFFSLLLLTLQPYMGF